MDANKGEDEYRSKGNRTKYGEGVATSCGKQNIMSCRKQYYVKNMDVTRTDKRVCRQREEEESTRVWEQRMGIDERYTRQDYCRDDYNREKYGRGIENLREQYEGSKDAQEKRRQLRSIEGRQEVREQDNTMLST